MEDVIHIYIYVIYVIHTHTHMYIIRKSDILPFTITLTDLEHIMLSEISQKKASTI